MNLRGGMIAVRSMFVNKDRTMHVFVGLVC